MKNPFHDFNYNSLIALRPEEWRGLSLEKRELLKQYVPGRFRGFYTRLPEGLVYVGKTADTGDFDYKIAIIDKRNVRITSGTSAKEVYTSIGAAMARHRSSR